MTQPNEHDLEQDIFVSAIELPIEEREAYLNQACAVNSELRSQIDELLNAYDKAANDGFLDHPTGGIADTSSVAQPIHPEEQLGAMIGTYQLTKILGEGGFGTVYEAIQETPIKRRVALKVIKLGMDTKQVITRFEVERQSLAMMDHPGIARVIDAGATQSGRPFFVMEIVDGEPITQYCDRNQLTIRQRLELFQEVCRAVQHAHLKGVIHRDLKPSNILVTEQDNRPVPKVIDFGIAKATEQSSDQHTVVTQMKQMLGTPAYMSPEQAGMSRSDIDTRSDVYSLGIILYELLTGSTPFESTTSISKSPIELHQAILEHAPSKPSTKLSKIQDIAKLSKDRKCDSKKLNHLIQGDLDWITLKAIDKDRSRRYETPNSLARDIGRYLSNESVEATPPSVRYTAFKFMKRNRLALVSLSAIILVLCIGMLSTGIFALRSVRAEKIAENEASSARIELARATEIKALLAGMLNSISPDIAQGRDTTVLNSILAKTAERVDEGLITDELVKAEIANTLGNVYVRIGDGNAALHFAQIAFDIRSIQQGIDSPVTIETRSILAESHDLLGNIDEAESIYLSNIEIMSRLFGPEDRRTLVGQLDLIDFRSVNSSSVQSIDDVRQFYNKNLRILGNNDPNTVAAKHVLANHLVRAGKVQESTDLLFEVVATMRELLGDDDTSTINAISGLGVNLLTLNRPDEAEPLIRESIERARRIMGDRHPRVPFLMNNLAYLMLRKGQPDEAVKITREVIQMQSELLGHDHPSVIQTSVNLGGLLASLKRFDEATVVMTDALANAKRVLGDSNPNTLRLLNNLGGVLIEQGRLDEALPILSDTLTLKRKIQGADHPDTIRTMINLGTVYEQSDRKEEAAELYRTAYQVRVATLEATSLDRVRTSLYLAPVLLDINQSAEVQSMLTNELAGARHLWTVSEPERLSEFLTLLGRASYAQGLLQQAEIQLRESLELVSTEEVDSKPIVEEPLNYLIDVLQELHEAEPTSGHDEDLNDLRSRFSEILN